MVARPCAPERRLSIAFCGRAPNQPTAAQQRISRKAAKNAKEQPGNGRSYRVDTLSISVRRAGRIQERRSHENVAVYPYRESRWVQAIATPSVSARSSSWLRVQVFPWAFIQTCSRQIRKRPRRKRHSMLRRLPLLRAQALCATRTRRLALSRALVRVIFWLFQRRWCIGRVDVLTARSRNQ